MTKTMENPLPDGVNDDQQTNSLANYFEDKILTIRRMFADKPEYSITPTDVPKLTRFAPVTENQVELIVKSMKPKACKLDPIPTHILKTMLPAVLLIITKLVNVSLGTGVFHRTLKTGTVKPLLKKIGLQLINNNYRPVSYLSFILKLTEKS